MSLGTVFPEMVMGFAETVTQAVEIGEKTEWSADEIRQVAAACRETREKFGSLEDMLRQELTDGVEVTQFVNREEPRLARLDEILRRHTKVLAEADGILASLPGTLEISEGHKLMEAWELLGQAISQVCRLLKEAISKMKTPRRPVDWQRIEEAQAAFSKGETKPFDGTPRVSFEK